MIRKITIIAILFLSMIGYSQTEKGNFFLGMDTNSLFSASSVHLERSDSDETLDISSSLSFSFSTKAGYFFANNFVVGALIDLNRSSNKFDSGGDDLISNSTNYSLGPFVRYYFLEDNIKLFIDGAYIFEGFSAESRERDAQTFFTENNNNYFNLGLGLAFFVKKYLALELSLNYTRRSEDNSNSSQDFEITRITNQFQSRIGFSIFL